MSPNDFIAILIVGDCSFFTVSTQHQKISTQQYFVNLFVSGCHSVPCDNATRRNDNRWTRQPKETDATSQRSPLHRCYDEGG